VALDDQIEERGEHWFRWKPLYAESAAYDDISEAIQAFEPVETPAGHAAAKWLKESALDDYPSTATWLAYLDQRIEGYFALCSGEVPLYGRQRRQFLRRPGRRREHVLHPRQPASLITWLGKHRHAKINGRTILAQATHTAIEVAELQGNIALVLDPYDDQTATFWLDRYDFLHSESPKRLWLPLRESWAT
jgi:hypothetical protein